MTIVEGERSNAMTRGAVMCLVLFVVVAAYVAPLFVSKPLTSDTVLYDLQADAVLQGGVAYRDIFEPNLPGAIWAHMVIRSVIGRSSEAIRIFDLVILFTNLWLLSLWLKRCNVGLVARLLTATMLLLFYASMSEWCHCQRDSWMLLPTLCGLFLRWRNHCRRHRSSFSDIKFRAFLEGTVWAMAFWLKPFIAVPALGCLVISMLAGQNRRQVTSDLLGVLKGGLFIGAVGTIWLMATGAWPWLMHTLMDWNPEYFSSGKQRWTMQRLEFMNIRFYPWLYLHTIAIPVAATELFQWFRKGRTDQAFVRPAMFAAFYLGWFFQSFAFQHLMDYIHVPAVLLATAVIVGHAGWTVALPVRRFVVAGFLWVVVFNSHLLKPNVASIWSRCLSEGSTAENRSLLSDANFPNWLEMEPVVAFLNSKKLNDGELTCYNVHTIHFYERLNLRPSTRYVGLSSLITLFPSRNTDMASALRASRQRYVVTELVESGLRVAEATMSGETETSLPPAFPKLSQSVFPFSHPVVFRSGRYLVHEVLPQLGTIVGRIPGR